MLSALSTCSTNDPIIKTHNPARKPIALYNDVRTVMIRVDATAIGHKEAYDFMKVIKSVTEVFGCSERRIEKITLIVAKNMISIEGSVIGKKLDGLTLKSYHSMLKSTL